MLLVRAANPNAAIPMAWAKCYFWAFTSFLFVYLFVCLFFWLFFFSLPEIDP